MKYLWIIWFLVLTVMSCDRKGEKGGILFYQDPSDPTRLSDLPLTNSLGQVYQPVYDTSSDQTAQIIEAWYFTCPMHPDVKTHTAGSCPICKMDLVPVDYPKSVEAPIDFYYCPMHPEVREEQKGLCPQCSMELAPFYTRSETAQSTVSITSQQEQNLGIQVSEVTLQSLEKNIRTVGRVSMDEKRRYLITARIDGRVDQLLVNYTGARISQGQPLLLLYSPGLVTAQQELLQAWKDYNTTRDSGQDQLLSLSGPLLDSARKKLKLLGLSDRQIQKVLDTGEYQLHTTLYSPVKGTVLKLNAVTGMYVKEGAELYEIVDLSRIWIEAEIFEQDISVVSLGMRADITVDSFPGQLFQGRVSFIYPVMNPNTRTLRIRIELDNPGEMLKPEMYVNLVLRSNQQNKALVIPDTALLDTGMRKLVYVSLGEGKYEGREVQIKPRAGEFYPVISGLQLGEKVVTYGAYLLDSQAQLSGSASIQYSGSLDHKQ